jgi:putative tricarboxylic transport membrane protein
MAAMEVFFNALMQALHWQNLLALVVGGLYGIIIGVLPGIGTAVGMALALPLTLKWPPATALIFLCASYKLSGYGGSITAIIINTPGESANAATVLDGFPMCEKGEGGIALGASCASAVVGGLIGTLCLIFFSPVLAKFALRFDAAEYCLVAIFALTVISTVIEGAVVKGLISAGIGLMLATVGFDGVSGNLRFTFGMDVLADGVPMIQALVGLFAITQAMELAESTEAISKLGELKGGVWDGFKKYFHYPWNIIRSSAIGLFIGVLPAVGQTAAGFLAYMEAVRESKHPETFGKGDIEGVIAPETANNACMPGDLVCTIALGVPGSVGAAVFLGIMIIFGVPPGPLAFTDKADVIYTLFMSLMLAHILILIFGFTSFKYFARVSLVPNVIIVPSIIAVSLIGSYAIRNSMIDVVLSLFFGFLGYIMNKTNFSPIPLLIGLVLGDMVEKNFHRALLMSEGSLGIFTESAVCKVLLVLILFSLFYQYISLFVARVWRMARGREQL